MNRDRYRRFREYGYSPLRSAEYARVPLEASIEEEVDALWLTWLGFEVCVRWTVDRAPREARGTFTKNPRSVLWGARKLKPDLLGANRYFQPTMSAWAHRRSLSRLGVSKQVAMEAGERFVSQDIAITFGHFPPPVLLVVTVYTPEGVRVAQQRYGAIEIGEIWPTHTDVLDYLATDLRPVDDTVATAERILAERRD